MIYHTFLNHFNLLLLVHVTWYPLTCLSTAFNTMYWQSYPIQRFPMPRCQVPLGLPLPRFPSNASADMTYFSFTLFMTYSKTVDCLFLMLVTWYQQLLKIHKSYQVTINSQRYTNDTSNCHTQMIPANFNNTQRYQQLLVVHKWHQQMSVIHHDTSNY